LSLSELLKNKPGKRLATEVLEFQPRDCWCFWPWVSDRIISFIWVLDVGSQSAFITQL